MEPQDSPSRRPFRLLRKVVKWSTTLVAVHMVILMLLLVILWRAETPVAFDTEAASAIGYTPFIPLVPGPASPESLEPMPSNNNVDLVEFEGHIYMAYRTAPTHFASSKTRMVVVSTADRENWTTEISFGLDQSDMREPRFLVFKGKLFLYFFRGGSNPMGFEPHSIYAMERGTDCVWTEPQTIFEPGYVVWRAKTHGDLAYMSVYHGAGLYTTGERAGEIRLLTSTDGLDWSPISKEPQCIEAGAEEAEFEFDEEGNLVATIRLEVQGALICRAAKDNLSKWETHYTREKYDSALMFRRGEDFYVIARRNVAGEFNRGLDWLPESLARGWYLARYSLTRKRTALYRVDLAANKLTPLLDFPSNGDTAFPALVPLDDHRYIFVNYSNDIDGWDRPWLAGQLGNTSLYASELEFKAP